MTGRLLVRETDDDIKNDVLLVQAGLMGAIVALWRRDIRDGVRELLERAREAETLLFQFEHRRENRYPPNTTPV